MKRNLNFLATTLCCLAIFTACQNDPEPSQKSFLKDIRPNYFGNLNFDSASVVSNIPNFLDDLSSTYDDLEVQYNSGKFTTPEDLDNMRLVGMYYSFYLLALGGNYMDGNITFADINGQRDVGLFSKLNRNDADFEKKELNAMMQRAKKVSYQAVFVNGFNDKTYGFYLSVRQVQERLKTKNFTNNPETQDSVITYVGTRLVDFQRLPDWNILMSMVTFSNYADSLNTFKNTNMDYVLFNVNARLIPGQLADLGGIFPEILGPIYRFDLNLKKIDWLLDEYEVLGAQQIKDLDSYIQILDTASHFVETDKKSILDAWQQKSTFENRKVKLAEIKNYRLTVSDGSSTSGRPELKSYLNSKEFKKAYQCYSCHKGTGIQNLYP